MPVSFDSNGVKLVERSLLGRRRREGRLFADERGVWLDGQLALARSGMVSASVVPRDHGDAVVRIERSGRRRATEIVLCDLAAARELVRALGFEGGQHALVVRLPSRVVCDQALRERLRGAPLGITAVAAVVIFGSFGMRAPAFTGVLFLLWLLSMLGFLGACFVSSRLLIGADGVLLSWAGGSRYISYSDIQVINGLVSAPWQPGGLLGVQITPVRGAPLRLWISNAAQVYERLDEAVAAWWRRDAAERAALSARGDRGTREWLSGLRALSAAATIGYRQSSIADELWRIVEDVAAPADARVGAAVALRRWIGDDGRERLRRAAASAAHPRLRVAMEAAAGAEDDEAMLDALDGLGDERPVPPARVA